ncbi:MAG: FAD-binding oxidoreductase, partial [Simkaniaceae bacterium]|nr:FAD-binding oxidoreductase [Simkaniaceae bacterium]
MKIAIIGAGFSGLGACYHLLQQHAHDVTIFEASKIGGGASGVSSGLLNPYFGEHGRLSFRAREGLLETKKLLAVASKALGKPVSKPGIIHVSANAKQCISWKDHPNRFDDVKSLNISDYNFYFPFEQPRIFIESAETVFPALYLEGLWRACKNLGAKLIQAKISHSRELLEYDKVLFAVGGAIKDFEEGKDLSLKFVKGQSLYCKKPEDLPIINHSTVAKGHVAISP